MKAPSVKPVRCAIYTPSSSSPLPSLGRKLFCEARPAYETFVTESQTIGVLYGDLAKRPTSQSAALRQDDPDKLISLPRGVRARSPCSSRVFFGSSLNMAVEQ